MDEEVQMVEEFNEAPAGGIHAMENSGETYKTAEFMSTTMMTSIVTETAKILTSTVRSTIASTPELSSSLDSSTSTTVSSGMSVEATAREDYLFSTIDYAIFTGMLLLSALIGVYFGFVSKIKQNNTKEYLLGGKTMSKFPVSASLIAT